MKEIRGRYLVGRAARSSAFWMIAKREKMQKLTKERHGKEDKQPVGVNGYE